MNVNQIMHQLAKRKHPEYNWDHRSSHDQHWVISSYDKGMGFPAEHLKSDEDMCLVCDLVYKSRNEKKDLAHGLEHLKEYNLLAML